MYKVIKFGASWCKVCQRLSEDLKNNPLNIPNVDFVEVDIDNNDEMTTQYDVTSIPYTIIFDENNKEIARVQGYKTYELYKNFIKSHTKIRDTYNKDQCVYGPDSKANCKFCSHMCRERYEDFKKRGIKVEYI